MQKRILLGCIVGPLYETISVGMHQSLTEISYHTKTSAPTHNSSIHIRTMHAACTCTLGMFLRVNETFCDRLADKNEKHITIEEAKRSWEKKPFQMLNVMLL